MRFSIGFRSGAAIVAAGALVLAVGCDALDQDKLMQQGQVAVEQGQAAVQEGAATVGEELDRELSQSGINYPDTPQGVFTAARIASTEGKWPMYLTYISPSSVERMAQNFAKAAVDGKVPDSAFAGPDAVQRIEAIREVLKEHGITVESVRAEGDDAARTQAVLGNFVSSDAFVAEVMTKIAPTGVAELPPDETVQWNVAGETATATYAMPNGPSGAIALKKLDGLWKIDL